MNYLLDTHYVLWSLFNPELIRNSILQILEDEQSTKYVSGIKTPSTECLYGRQLIPITPLYRMI